MKLNKKQIVITGGTAGIGLELVKHLAPANKLWVIGRKIEALKSWKERFPSIVGRRCDLSKALEVSAFCREWKEQTDIQTDVLICNAAIQNPSCFGDAEHSEEAIAHEIAVNFTSVCHLVDAFVWKALHDEQRQRSIVMVNSGLGLAPKRTAAIYCATKAALRSLGFSLRYQLKATRIHITQVYLPLVDTEMTRGRGSGKITATTAADSIINAIEREESEVYVGKTKILVGLLQIFPWLARRIMAAN
jgi:uncharacterized oxidoreductase